MASKVLNNTKAGSVVCQIALSWSGYFVLELIVAHNDKSSTARLCFLVNRFEIQRPLCPYVSLQLGGLIDEAVDSV